MKIEANNRAAFTLIEMIIAIGVSALVLVAVTTVLFTALNLHESTLEMVGAEAPVDSATAIIRRDLQCCVTPTNGTANVLSGDFRVGNNISSSGLSDPVAIEMFTATGALSDSAPWGDIQRVTYELKNPSDPSAIGKDLYRTVMRNLLPVATVTLSSQLVLTGVASVKFSCFDGSQWQDTWDTTSQFAVNTNLPAAVRVDIQMAGHQNAGPVEIIVPIDSRLQGQSNLVAATTGE